MNIYEKLSAIQSEVSVPKNLENKFGGFKYRSAEMILETVKPICRKHKAVLTISDELRQIGDRYYVEARAELKDTESDDSIVVTAFAREEEAKKGMDASQVTGSTSSYARKYALNGLFNLDDNKDPDSDEFTQMKRDAEKKAGEEKIQAQNDADKPITKTEEAKLVKLIENIEANSPLEERIKGICGRYGINSLTEMKKSQYTHCVNMLSKVSK